MKIKDPDLKTSIDSTIEESIEVLKKNLDLTPLLKQSEGYEIVDERSAKKALSMSLQARKIRKSLDHSRYQIVRPHVDFQKAINKIVKDYEEKLKEIETSLSEKVSKWIQEDIFKIKSIEVEDGTLSIKNSWDWSLLDSELIPREFLCIDEKKIEEAVKQGIRKIPGIQIFEKENMSLRVKN